MPTENRPETEAPRPRRHRGAHRETMVLKIPVDPKVVAEANGSYQRLAGIIFRKLQVTLDTAIESQKDSLRHQAEASRLAAQLAQIEDHRAEVEVEVGEEEEETAAVG